MQHIYILSNGEADFYQRLGKADMLEGKRRRAEHLLPVLRKFKNRTGILGNDLENKFALLPARESDVFAKCVRDVYFEETPQQKRAFAMASLGIMLRFKVHPLPLVSTPSPPSSPVSAEDILAPYRSQDMQPEIFETPMLFNVLLCRDYTRAEDDSRELPRWQVAGSVAHRFDDGYILSWKLHRFGFNRLYFLHTGLNYGLTIVRNPLYFAYSLGILALFVLVFIWKLGKFILRQLQETQLPNAEAPPTSGDHHQTQDAGMVGQSDIEIALSEGSNTTSGSNS